MRRRGQAASPTELCRGWAANNHCGAERLAMTSIDDIVRSKLTQLSVLVVAPDRATIEELSSERMYLDSEARECFTRARN